MKVNFMSRTVTLTQKEMKNASRIDSYEYHCLLKVMKDLPNFEIQVEEPRPVYNQNTGLTYRFMEEYISSHAEERMEDFWFLRHTNKYFEIVQWFRNTFPESIPEKLRAADQMVA